MPTITTAYKGDMLFESQLGNHSITIDVPPAMGGADRGPTPPELFVASLGSCVGAFVATYCQQAGIDISDMTVDVSFDKVDNPTRLANLRITAKLPHGHCKQREQALKRVAAHCPVHETISTLEGIEIVFEDEAEFAPA
jgi:putative redox protein